jgi:hypothetical protein
MGKLTISIVIFHSYVKLPEGKFMMNFRDYGAPNLGQKRLRPVGPGTNCKAWRFASNSASLLPRVGRRGVHVVHKTCHRQISSENLYT